jgi:hypothetical protein
VRAYHSLVFPFCCALVFLAESCHQSQRPSSASRQTYAEVFSFTIPLAVDSPISLKVQPSAVCAFRTGPSSDAQPHISIPSDSDGYVRFVATGSQSAGNRAEISIDCSMHGNHSLYLVRLVTDVRPRPDMPAPQFAEPNVDHVRRLPDL